LSNSEAEIVWTGRRSLAESLLSAILPDDPEDFDAHIDGEGEIVNLIIRVKSSNLRNSRNTVDDILSCLSVAESGLQAVE